MARNDEILVYDHVTTLDSLCEEVGVAGWQPHRRQNVYFSSEKCSEQGSVVVGIASGTNTLFGASTAGFEKVTVFGLVPAGAISVKIWGGRVKIRAKGCALPALLQDILDGFAFNLVDTESQASNLDGARCRRADSAGGGAGATQTFGIPLDHDREDQNGDAQ